MSNPRYSVVCVGEDSFGIKDSKRPCLNSILTGKNRAQIEAECSKKNADKLVKMYSVDGPLYVLQSQLDDLEREIIVAHNRKGERYEGWNVPKTRHGEGLRYGCVHRENIAVSRTQAIANREAVYKELFPSLYV